MALSSKRSRLFVDRPIQGALLVRVLLYWGVSVLTQVLMVAFFLLIWSSADDFYTRGAQLRWYLQLMLLASALVLPLILVDIMRLSHRWVGPIFRLRSALAALSRNEHVAPLRFREGDFWQELAGDFNTIAAELSRARSGVSEEAVTER